MDVTLLDPLHSGIGLRALAEIVLLGVLSAARSSFWVVAERLTYGAESLAHGLLPGVVGAALVGRRPCSAAPPRASRGGAARRARRRATSASAPTRRPPSSVSGMLGLGALLALAPDRASAARASCCSATCSRSAPATWSPPAVLVAGGGAALAALHRPLAAVAFDPVGAAALGRAARPRCGSRCCGCSPPRSRSPSRGSGTCSCWRYWSLPRSPSGGTRRAPGGRCWPAAAVAVVAGVAGI